MKSKWVILSSLLIVLLAVFLKVIEVPLNVTKTDVFYIHKILSRSYPKQSDIQSFEEELSLIQRVMKDTLKVISRGKEIPEGHPREVKDFYAHGSNAAHDISRVVEQIFRHLGFKVRHATLYPLNGKGRLRTLLTPDTPAHATTEILTQRGWMIVDPLTSHLALDWNRKPISLARALKEVSSPPFKEKNFGSYSQNFTYVYGLYSRSGKFYTPFWCTPNINWREFWDNFRA